MFMGFDLASRKAVIYNTSTDTYSTTRLSSIGLAVRNYLLHSTPQPQGKNTSTYPPSPSHKNRSSLCLRKPRDLNGKSRYVDAEEQKRIGLDTMESGDLSGAMILIRYLNSAYGDGRNFSEYEESSNELLGVPVEGLEEIVEGIVKV